MSQYAFAATNLLTGDLLASSIPVTCQSASRTISMAGTFTGSLALVTTAGRSLLGTWIAALEPWRSVLWMLQDQQPVWGGPVTGWPHQSVTDGTLPVSASTIEAVFQSRVISSTLTFKNADIFDIFRGLALYATGKSPNAVIAGLDLGSALSGITDTVTFDGTQLQKVYDAWTWMLGEYGFEYSFRPAITPGGTLATVLDLGYPAIGRQLGPSGLQMVYPSPQVTDYAYPRVAQYGPANSVIATAQTSTKTYTSHAPHGQLADELSEGYPLLEDTASLTGLSSASQALVNAFADSAASDESVTAMATPTVKLGAEGYPKVSQVSLGDWAEFAASSDLHPPDPVTGAPGLQVQGRISSWTLYPPGGQQAEATWYTLSQVQEAP